jgi:hypothetical protein
MTITNKPVPQDESGQRKEGKPAVGTVNTNPELAEQVKRGRGQAREPQAGDVDNREVERDDLLEDGSTKEGAAEVPSDDDRGRGVSVNEARGGQSDQA